jgi:uncharacterized protein with GYD domain
MGRRPAQPGASVHLQARTTRNQIMTMYLTRATYSPDAFKGMLAKPEDREPAAKAMFDAAGVKLNHMWYCPNGEIVCIIEANGVAASAVSMVVLASGAFTKVESLELISMGQMKESMGKAGAVAAKYAAPGK